MTTEEICGKISAHLVEGMMFHYQMADYYLFLGLEGYSMCHKYHYISETLSRMCFHDKYLKTFNKLIKDDIVDSSKIVIPINWKGMSRLDIDSATKRNAVKTGITDWWKWENDTIQLYFDLCKEADAKLCDTVHDLACGVQEELYAIEQKYMALTAVNFDMLYILKDQKHTRSKYEEKMTCMNDIFESWCL